MQTFQQKDFAAAKMSRFKKRKVFLAMRISGAFTLDGPFGTVFRFPGGGYVILGDDGLAHGMETRDFEALFEEAS